MQEEQTTLPIKSVLRERYVVEALLGQGGFGAVYRVRDQRVKGNQYALKEVIEPNRKDRTRKDKSRFIFEADVLKRLDHRALPRVYRVFEDNAHSRAYTLMDYIDGPNLEVLRQQQPDKRLPLPVVITIMTSIIDAVHYLHNQEPPIIHRDIKPANIIVPAPHEGVLVDFDISKEYDPDTTTTAVRRCSPGYGAPEQYGQGTSTRTDIYGIGATIYALLTGIVPPDALHRMTIIGAKGQDPLLPIDQIVPAISQQVSETIQKAMALHSNDRFATIEQFWQAFDAYSTLKEEAVVPEASSIVFPLRSSQPPALAKHTSGNTTTVPTKKQSATAPAQPGKRRALSLVLLLLALFVSVASAISLWSFFGHHQNALSDTSKLRPQSTLSIILSPLPDPTHKPVAASVTRKVASMFSPTVSVPSSPTVSIQPSPTSVPIGPPAYPTTAPTVQPTSRPPAPQPTPQPTPMPTPSPTPDPYPSLSGAYAGTVVDTTPTPNITSNMSLTAVQQNRGNISGNFNVSAPLQGSGPFTGTVGTNKYIQFVVKGYNGNAPLYFWGFVQANQSIKGQYCSLDQSGQCSASVGAGGYWNVTPGLPGSS
ncbi:MAG: hypothetical protein NVS4B7_08050 [Ktedonobacteraceae bacterium]